MAKKILQLRQMGSADTHKLAYECQISENSFKISSFFHGRKVSVYSTRK